MDKTITIKVGGETKPGAAAIAISEYLLSGRRVVIDTIGVLANYNTNKALILTRSKLTARGLSVAFTPCFHDVNTVTADEDIVKTAIRWEVILLNQ